MLVCEVTDQDLRNLRGDAPGCMSSITVATYAMLDSADSEETGARCAVTEKSAGAMRDDKSILIETHLAVQDITSFFY